MLGLATAIAGRVVELTDDRLSGGRVDPIWYFATYPDIGAGTDPIAHYHDHGWREGRSPNADFSVEWYRATYPRVAVDCDPFAYHRRAGKRRGLRAAPHDFWRPDAWTAAHGGVDPFFYRARHGLDATVDAAADYTTAGWREGRDPNRAFSTRWYLASYPDIAAAGIDPLHHYLVSGMAEGRRAKPTVIATIRLREWWSHKISSIVAVAYATAIMLDISVAAMWPLLLALVAALGVAAAYVSVINDWSDRHVDLLGGKTNRLQGRSRLAVATFVAACMMPGAVFVAAFRHDPLVVALYVGIWIIFSLYSLPPTRLKYRGSLGPICDAVGAHVLPGLLSVALVCCWAQAPIDWPFFALVGCWSLGYGLRGILFHQRQDLVCDARAGMRTSVGTVGVDRIGLVEDALIVPFEAASLAALLIVAGSKIAVLVLAAGVLHVIVRKARRSDVTAAATTAHPPLFDLYEWQVPLALLATATLSDPRTSLVAIAHSLIFLRPRLSSARFAAVTWLVRCRDVAKTSLRAPVRESARPTSHHRAPS